MVDFIAVEQGIGKRMKRNESSLRYLWNNIKCSNIQIIGVSEEEKGKGPKKILEEIIVKKFPNMGKEIVTKVQEAQSFVQHKPKEEHTEKIINHTKKN